ncbi:MAG: HAMP domain-containing histidine kinase, partial [Campylobacterales bacterium]|nr:HAMP domain-containing histidine kinase [Campylobacterales bacterium]
DKERYELHKQERYQIIANSFFNQVEQQPSQYEIDQLSNKLNLKLLQDEILRLQLLNHASIVFQKENINSRFRIFKYNEKNYFYIQKVGYNLLFEDLAVKNYNLYIAIGLLFLVCVILLLLYIILLTKLRPLKTLHQTIMKFSKGDLSIYVHNDSKDEIGQIARNFNNAIENINSLLNSRNLFMRNIMHELKTPITKGLLLANMIQTNEDDKIFLTNIFNSMKDLVNQLTQVEKIKMSNLQIPKEQIDLKLIVDEVAMVLGITPDQINTHIQDTKVIANKELFFTLVKNIIENGIKYSQDHRVVFSSRLHSFEVSSKGEKLKNDLSYYTQAFTQEKKNSKGFGLGLYIVNEICNIHSFEFGYRYENGKNIFIVKW